MIEILKLALMVHALRVVQKKQGKGYKTPVGSQAAAKLEHQVDQEVARILSHHKSSGD